MDRKGQLRNVAFGGAWSEQIAGNEALADAMAAVEAAAALSADTDYRGDLAVAEAVLLVLSAHPRRAILAAAWDRALAVPDPRLRVPALKAVAEKMRTGIGVRLSSL